MPAIQMLCLANSYKHGGSCIAGIRLDTRSWVRPVSTAADGAVTAEMSTLDAGREVRPLDLVELPLVDPRPEPHQPENWTVGQGQWRLLGEYRIAQVSAFLDSFCQPGPALFGSTSSSIPYSQIRAHPMASSLALVRVSSPRFPPKLDNPNRLRAFFALGGQSYDLAVTDRSPWVAAAIRAGGSAPRTDWYLLISLTEPWEESGRCYKLVATGIEIGR